MTHRSGAYRQNPPSQAPILDVSADSAEVGAYLEALVDGARAVLRHELVGAYAAGSVALDAYQPGRSDVDVALVTTGPLPLDVKRELVARLRHEELPCPARGLELVVYREAVARSGSPDPGFELELNTGVAMPFRVSYQIADRPHADGWFWYGLDRSILHGSGRALLGPPAAELFKDLSPEDLRPLLVEALRWWLAAAPAAADDGVLGACRSLVRLRDGVWLAKVAAGRRLLAAGVGPAAVIEQAIAARSGGMAPDPGDARQFQQWVLARLLD